MQREYATYQEIQKWVQKHHGFVPETCWITHVKDLNGLQSRSTSNVIESIDPCPFEKRAPIAQAFRHFGML